MFNRNQDLGSETFFRSEQESTFFLFFNFKNVNNSLLIDYLCQKLYESCFLQRNFLVNFTKLFLCVEIIYES
jgi:hypothetical protein